VSFLQRGFEQPLEQRSRCRGDARDTVLGFKAAHRRDGDMSLLCEITLVEAKKSARGPDLFRLYHD
jgi:hypothetical protein